MKAFRWLNCGGAAVGTCALAMLAGCSIGASPDLHTFTASGGLWQRTIPDQGRVGSVFDPAGVRVGEPAYASVRSQRDAHAEANGAAADPQALEPEVSGQPPLEVEEVPAKPLQDIELEDIRREMRLQLSPDEEDFGT